MSLVYSVFMFLFYLIDYNLNDNKLAEISSIFSRKSNILNFILFL